MQPVSMTMSLTNVFAIMARTKSLVFLLKMYILNTKRRNGHFIHGKCFLTHSSEKKCLFSKSCQRLILRFLFSWKIPITNFSVICFWFDTPSGHTCLPKTICYLFDCCDETSVIQSQVLWGFTLQNYHRSLSPRLECLRLLLNVSDLFYPIDYLSPIPTIQLTISTFLQVARISVNILTGWGRRGCTIAHFDHIFAFSCTTIIFMNLLLIKIQIQIQILIKIHI